jgi:uncharacterized phage protein (TIGR02218 family)
VSYSTFEVSAHDGAPIEGYRFVGTATSYRYTNAQQDVTINGLLYTAAAVRRGAVRVGTHQDDGLELQVELPFNLALVQDYAFSVAPPDLELTVYRYHEGSDPAVDWVVAWRGKVVGFAVTGEVAQVRVPSVFELALRGTVPSVSYHNPCNHVLYDARCKVVKLTFTARTTISSISVDGLTIGVVNDGFADNVLKAGTLLLLAKGERRLIQSNVANSLGISYPFAAAAVDDAVELTAGCDHAYQGDCKNKFANTLNYGGFPYVPKDNPFEGEI